MFTTNYPVQVHCLLILPSCYDCHLRLDGGKPNLSSGRVIRAIPKRTGNHDLSGYSWVDSYCTTRTTLLLAEPQCKEKIWFRSALCTLIGVIYSNNFG